MSTAQHVLLVLLRTVIGWHFLYEGYVKLLRPAWGPDGVPLPAWSSAGYLRGATGPLASVFHTLADSAWIGTVDTAVAVALASIGLSLVLGLFTRLGCIGAMLLLTLFYVTRDSDERRAGTAARGRVSLRQQDADRARRRRRRLCLQHRTDRGPGSLVGRGPRPTQAHFRGGRGMNLTPELTAQGRRNFLKILAGTPALAALGVSAAMKGPVAGGPVRLGFIGVGGQGRVLLRNVDPGVCRDSRTVRHQPVEPENRRSGARRHEETAGAALRRVERDAAEGRHRSGHHGAAARLPRRPRRRLSRRRQARALREDDGGRHPKLRAHARRRDREAARCSRLAISAPTTRCTTRPTTAS